MTDFPTGDAFLASRALTDEGELSGLSAQDINRLSMAQYREIRRRAGLPDVDPFEQAYKDYESPGAPLQEAPTAPQPVQEQAQGIDVANMDMRQYTQLRAQLGLDKAGQDQGIFGSPGRQAQIDATRAQAGRTAMSQETHHPGFSRVFVQDKPAEGRTSWYRGA